MIDNNGFPKKFEEIKNFVYLPFDFVFHFYMAIPKTLKKKEVFEYVLHRLPKIYPGNISEIEIDIRPSTTIAEIFIIARDSLSKIREQNGDKKFTSLISILQPLTNSFIRIIVFDNWYEKAEYIDGRWTNFSSNSYDDFSFLIEYFDRKEIKVQLLCNKKNCEKLGRLSKNTATVISFNELNKQTVLNRQLFSKEKNKLKNKIMVILLVICLIPVNVISLLSSNRSEYLINEYQKELSKGKRSLKELEQINREIDKLNTSKNANGLNAVSIAKILEILAQYDPSLKLSQVSIETNKFSISGKVSDSIKLAEFLSNNDLFTDIALSGVQVLNNGEEQFGLTGKIK